MKIEKSRKSEAKRIGLAGFRQFARLQDVEPLDDQDVRAVDGDLLAGDDVVDRCE